MAKKREKQPKDSVDTAKALKGAAGFEAYYGALYKERWPVLRGALLSTPRYIALPPQDPERTDEYFLDAASVAAALALPISENSRILDMCAAPGGKSLILAFRMNSLKGASLVCNEISGARRNRLISVLNAYAPPSVREQISVAGCDGAKWCLKETEIFDRILLDAPCSSERHVLRDSKYLAQWSPARIKHLAQSQWALLSSAFRLLKPGGYILYATCALSLAENDDVVRKLLKKFPNIHFEAVELPEVFGSYKLPRAEKTDCGFHILPDIQEGAGPLYYSLIHKIA